MKSQRDATDSLIEAIASLAYHGVKSAVIAGARVVKERYNERKRIGRGNERED